MEYAMENAITQILSTDLGSQTRGATTINDQSRSNPSTCQSLARDARVIPRLVDLLKQRSDDCRGYVQRALGSLATAGTHVQLQIANALDAAALKVLDAHEDKDLLQILLRNPSAEAVLTAKRGKAQVLALFADASKSTNTTRSDEMMRVLCSVIVGSTFCPGGISYTEAQEVLLQFKYRLSNHYRGPDKETVLHALSTSVSERIRTADTGYQPTAHSRCAVLWLASTIQSDKTKRQEIVTEGGIAALIVALQLELSDINGIPKSLRLLSSGGVLLLMRQIVSALAVVSTDTGGRSEIIGRGGLNSLVAFCNVSDGDDTKLAVEVLEQFMTDDGVHHVISDAGGIPLLVRHLRFGSSDKLKIETIAILTKKYMFADPSNPEGSKAAIVSFGDCKGPFELCRLCKLSGASELQSSAERLLMKLMKLIPSLLQLSDLDSLGALEIMSRMPKNCTAIVQSGGIDILTRLLSQRRYDMGAAAMRILANLACKNDRGRALIGSEHLVSEMIKIVTTKSNSEDLVKSAAMVLRNLSNSDSIRTKIGRSGVIPHVVKLVTSPTSPHLQEIAAAILGNLGRQNHCLNQRVIAHFGGITALVEFARNATNKRHRQTAGMALWVLLKNNEDCRSQFLATDGIQVIKRIHELHEPESQPWTTRIIATVHPLADCRS